MEHFDTVQNKITSETHKTKCRNTRILNEATTFKVLFLEEERIKPAMKCANGNKSGAFTPFCAKALKAARRSEKMY
jgi:hypothetical protein